MADEALAGRRWRDFQLSIARLPCLDRLLRRRDLHAAGTRGVPRQADVDVLSGGPWAADRPTRLIVPDTSRVEGICRPDGQWETFARDTEERTGVLRIRFSVALVDGERRHQEPDESAHEVIIELVDYPSFTAACGAAAPDPLDSNAGYRGWRLP